MFRKFVFIISVLLLPAEALADKFNIELSNSSARLGYAAEIFGGTLGPTSLETTFYTNKDKDKILQLGLQISNDTLDNPLIIGFGARLYYADVGNHPGQSAATSTAIAIGGEVLYVPDAFNGFGLGILYYIAPSVTTFQDGDGFDELRAFVNYAVSEQASFYIGYRSFNLKIENGNDIDVESGFIFGFNLRL